MRVGFIVQMPELWDYQIDVYNELKSRDYCETVIIVIPPYDQQNGTVSSDYSNNFFLQQYPDAVRALNTDGSVIDIQSLSLSYVFLQRPYDVYLPPELRSSALMKHTRCCYIPYGYSGSSVFDDLNSNPQFFSNCYFSFSESARTNDLLRKKYAKNVQANLQHFEYLGYPAFDQYLTILDHSERKLKRILWTPRWTSNKAFARSHFIDYKDLFLALAVQFPDIQFAFRPHPMMFDEFIKTGIMTAEEVATYKDALHARGILYEHNIKVFDSLKDTDLLITDYSSIVNLFFLTGRPIISCETDLTYSGLSERMSRYFYIAEKAQDILTYIHMLQNGEDPYREDRLSLISREFPSTEPASVKIVDCMFEDYNS